MRAVILINIASIMHESFTLFLNSVVSQMHEKVFKVAFLRALVFFGGEASESLLVDVDAERVHTVNECVDAKVEF